MQRQRGGCQRSLLAPPESLKLPFPMPRNSRPERTIIIGDVHGCYDELRLLLKECDVRSKDRVIFVGDLVAKGPKSREVVRWARKNEALAVRGNHDEHCLRWWRSQRDGQPAPELRPQHQVVCHTLKKKDFLWLDSLPHFIELPDLNAIVVHAGVETGIPLKNQSPRLLMNMRSVLPDGSGSKKLSDGVPWASLWSGPEHIYFGHDALRGLQQYEHATGLDTGCVYGGKLTAVILPDEEFISVPAKENWHAKNGSA